MVSQVFIQIHVPQYTQISNRIPKMSVAPKMNRSITKSRFEGTDIQEITPNKWPNVFSLAVSKMVYCIEMVIWCYLNRENDDKAWNLGVFYFVTIPFGGEDFCSHHWCRLGLERDLASYSTIMSAGVRHKKWLVQRADQETLVVWNTVY